MTLLVIGASARTVGQFTATAASRGLRVVTGNASRPSWVIVATATQRRDALARFGLPTFRVIEWSDIDGEAAVAADILCRGVARMAEIGEYRPIVSPVGVALTKCLMPWIRRVLDRAIGPDDPSDEVLAAEAAQRDARALAKAKVDNPEEGRRRAERKARLATERDAKRAASRLAAQGGEAERPR